MGDLTPTRDLLYVKDTVKGFIEIYNCTNLIGHECNIATNSEFSMQDVADTLIELINKEAKIITDTNRIRPQKSEVFRLYGDNSKISDFTNWKVEYDLKKGLMNTIDWFSNPNNLKHYKSGIYNV